MHLFKNLLKLNLFIGSIIKRSADNEWTPDFQTKPKYRFNPLVISYKYLKNYNKFKKTFDIKSCAKVYDLLEDEYSKNIYIKVLMYWFFKNAHIRFPYEYSLGLINFSNKYDYLLADDTRIDVPNGTLNKYDLRPVDCNFEIIFGNKLAFYISFILEQYNYRDFILPKPGDIVIDGGACYGDSALFFIDKMKGQGDIYSFEFTEKNLEILKTNLELNPHYKDRIHIIQKAISAKNETLYVNYNASASYCIKNSDEHLQQVESISIDEFISKSNIKKVDFIKFDIEGFEQEGIRGASQTIKKYKPKLAICIYHKKNDLWEIPLMIKDLVPEYKFYLDHYTLNTEETVIYGIVQ